MPELARIIIYPIKAIDGVEITQATVLASGALQHDREFAIVDSEGNFVNGKRTAKVHGIRSRFDLNARTVSLSVQGEMSVATFHLDDDRAAAAQWLSGYFGFPVQLLQDTQTGFPDDTAAPGPTVVTTATLQAIAGWFPDLRLEEIRQRFRSNLEIRDTEPFWEDHLFGAADQLIPFQIGAVQFAGVNPCQRCIVVTRDPISGSAYPNFQKTFVAKRKETLPDWVDTSRFNHFYRLAVNTRLSNAEAGKRLCVGDAVND